MSAALAWIPPALASPSRSRPSSSAPAPRAQCAVPPKAPLKQARNFRAAEALYRRVLEAEPDNWEAHNNLGNLLADRADFAGSVAAFKQALAINPNFADGHNNLGTVLREMGNLDAAVACYRRALEIREQSLGENHQLVADSLDALAEVLWNDNQKSEAFAMRKRAKEIRAGL